MVRLPPPLRPLFPQLKRGFVFGTRLVSGPSRGINRLRGGLLPTGSVATLLEAAQRSGGQYRRGRRAERLERDSIQGLPPALPLIDLRDGDTLDELGAAELPGGRVLGMHRAVITGTGEFVLGVSRYFDTRRFSEQPMFWNPFPPQPLDVPGRLGVLATRFDANYYHFLMDGLSRISLLEQSGFDPPDQWYVPAQQRFQRELLDALGIPAERRVEADLHPHVRAETLLIAEPPAMIEKNPPWVVDWLRGRFADVLAGCAPTTPIYVTRGTSANNRAVLNEDEVMGLLAERGFTFVDPGQLSVFDQMRTFANASIIVAPHGAALANLIFASPGATAIELFPAGCLLPDYWRLTCGVPGLRYRYLASAAPGERLPGRQPSRQGAIVRDIRVNLSDLATLIDQAG
jgi:hypothetical protein